MLKLVSSLPQSGSVEPEITILNLDSDEQLLEKKAAHEEISGFISSLKPKPGYTYLHINAMTAGEFHGSNRNMDMFPEENLKKCFKTFETSPAYVYRAHINKNPEKSFGKVIFAIYNERMHRVELVAECPDDLVADVNARIQKGDFPTTSMACRTPYDTCSICGHRARSRQEYCVHLSTQLGKLYPDGRKVFAINDGPLTFFDISIVSRPADVNSSILQKVADDGSVIGSAELAETEGLTEDSFLRKKAEFMKWSELVKEITDGLVMESTPASALLKNVSDLPESLVGSLEGFDLAQVLTAMADLGINPSIAFLSELIARKHLGAGWEGIGDIVTEYVKSVPEDSVTPVIRFSDVDSVNPVIYTALKPFVHGSSLFASDVEKRASYIGYAGNGPIIQPKYEETKIEEMKAKVQPGVESFISSHGKLLLSLGTAALLAKFFINSQIDRKLREQAALQASKNNVKIVIVKQASDYATASHLGKAGLHQSLSKDQDSGSSVNSVGIANRLARRMLKNTNSVVGGKLATLLRLGGVGYSVHSNIQ